MNGVRSGSCDPAVARSRRPSPLVAASASTADLEHAEADPSTFAACLRKPFQTGDLLDTIRAQPWAEVAPRGDRPREASVRSQPVSDLPDAQLVAPPQPVLEELLELARLGKLVRVEQIALELEQQDALRALRSSPVWIGAPPGRGTAGHAVGGVPGSPA